MAARDNYIFITVPKDPWVSSNTGKRFTVRQLDNAVRNQPNITSVVRELGLKSSGHVTKFVRYKIVLYGLTHHTYRWKTRVKIPANNSVPTTWGASHDKYLPPPQKTTVQDLINQTTSRRTHLIGNPRTTVKPTEVNKAKLEQSARLFLEAIGEDIERDGLKETPKRYANYMADIMGGKFIDTAQYVKDFENDGNYDGPVVVTKMPFYTVCEHHLAPFIGTWDFAYKPKDRILGLSKVVRIARKYQKQPQVQERLTQQIAEEMFSLLKPEWVVVRMAAEHFCMSTRGVRTPGALTYTRKSIVEKPEPVWETGKGFVSTLVTQPNDILPIPAGE